jgi:hypothetical protein
MKKTFVILLIVCGCRNVESDKTTKPDSVIVVQAKPSVAQYRSAVSKKAVKTFSKPIVNSAIQGAFAVQLFETKKTFHYLMKIKYAEFDATDTLKLPNFGSLPKPEIKPGRGPNSCIVGFYDDENNFKEYKLIEAKNDRLKIKALNHYAVATYRDTM